MILDPEYRRRPLPPFGGTLDDGELDRVEPIRVRAVGRRVLHERDAAVRRRVIEERDRAAVIAGAKHPVWAGILTRDRNVVRTGRAQHVRTRQRIHVARVPVDVRRGEAHAGRQLPLVAAARLDEQRLLEGVGDLVANGTVHADEVGSVQIRVDLAGLIQIVAVVVVPFERGVLERVLVELDSLLRAEDVAKSTGERLEDAEFALVPCHTDAR